MRVYLLHHAAAVGPEVDPQRPLSSDGLAHASHLAEWARTRGCTPAVIWHSGKLRARQTAEPEIAYAAILNESRDVLLAGHWPHLPALLRRFVGDAATFPPHGLVAIETADAGVSWKELWRSF